MSLHDFCESSSSFLWFKIQQKRYENVIRRFEGPTFPTPTSDAPTTRYLLFVCFCVRFSYRRFSRQISCPFPIIISAIQAGTFPFYCTADPPTPPPSDQFIGVMSYNKNTAQGRTIIFTLFLMDKISSQLYELLKSTRLNQLK